MLIGDVGSLGFLFAFWLKIVSCVILHLAVFWCWQPINVRSDWMKQLYPMRIYNQLLPAYWICLRFVLCLSFYIKIGSVVFLFLFLFNVVGVDWKNKKRTQFKARESSLDYKIGLLSVHPLELNHKMTQIQALKKPNYYYYFKRPYT